MFVCAHVGVSNPVTDLVCKPTSNQIGFGNFKPQIEVSWNAPVPNGGQGHIYVVTWLSVSSSGELIYGQQQIEESTNDIISLSSEGVFDIGVWVLGYELSSTCSVDTRDRCEYM